MTELARFGISIDPRLLSSFDQLITTKGYVDERARRLAKDARFLTIIKRPCKDSRYPPTCEERHD